MKHNASIEQIFDDMDHSIIKKISVFPYKSSVLFVLSVGIIVLDRLIPHSIRNSFTPLFAIVVLVLLFWGFFSGILEKNYYKNLVTGQKINFIEHFYERTDYEHLTNIIANGDFFKLSNLRRSNRNGIKLKIAYTNDHQICYVQVLKYVPFQYAMRTEAKQLAGNETEELLEFLHQTSYAI